MTKMRAGKLFGLGMALSAALALHGCGGCGGGGATDVAAGPAPVPVVASGTALDIALAAGSLQRAGGQDGLGAAAQFNRPQGVAVDGSGNVYIADTGNHTIRRLSPDGTVVTLAGRAGLAGSSDGRGAAARFSSPQGVAVDAAGNVYVADTGNHTIRRIDPAGVVGVVAGSAGQQGDVDGPGAAARFNAPVRVAIDGGGNLLVADRGNRKVRKIAAGAAVSTFWSDPALPQPLTGLAVDRQGNVYIARTTPIIGGSLIRKLDRDGREVPWPADGSGSFSAPPASDIAVGPDGAVYVVSGGPMITGRDDGGFVSSIWRISPTGGVTMIAGIVGRIGMTDGSGAQATFDRPTGIASSPGGLVIADTGNSAIRQLDLATATVGTLAGGVGRGVADGVGPDARFHDPDGIAAGPDGSLFVVERGNRALRRLAPDGRVATVPLVGSGGGTQAFFGTLSGVAADRQGLVYMAGHGALTPPVATYVYSVNAAGVSTLAVRAPGPPVGVAEPVAVDDLANLYVRNGAGGIAVLAPGSGLRDLVPTGLDPVALAAGFGRTLYAATAETVLAVNPQGVATVVAGRSGQPGHADGSGADSRFAGISALALDREGNLFIADASFTIRRLSPDGMVRTVAGTAGLAGAAPGPAPGVLGPVRGMTWSGNALFATVDNAVLKIAFSQ